jgi:sugar phosphate isomerase/epimerase
MERRMFLQHLAVASGTLPLLSLTQTGGEQAPSKRPPILVFSKHLHFLPYKEMAEKAKELGFDGVDLTVRPGGHVLPERVEEDLPKAVEAIRKAGLDPTMMTTAIERADSPLDSRVLHTAARLGIRYYRMNWYRYSNDETMPKSLEKYRAQVAALSRLNKQLNLVGCYQNHAGMLIGSSIWEVWEMLRDADPATMGTQYDIRHATVEGGLSWQNGLRLIYPHIKVLAVKDSIWEQGNGQWRAKNVPLGQGMVDYKTYFKLLKQYNVQVPISMHFEYDLGGADRGERTLTIPVEEVYAAMRRDIQTLHRLWDEA